MKDVSPRSSPLRDVSQGGTSATQQQKFHTDDVNQCLHNKSGSHGVPNAYLFNFTFLLVDFGQVSGLQIVAGQRTMFGLIADLTGQTLTLPVIFGFEHFFFHVVVT